MKKEKILTLLVIFSVIVFIASCEKILPGAPEEEEVLDGPLEGLTSAEMVQFLRGDQAFNNEIFTSVNGLGPVFVATSCGSCHAGDGKGHPFSTLTRYGQADSNGNTFLHLGGPQLQNRAIPGYTPETLPAGAPFSRFMPPANTGLGFIELVSDADILAMADPYDSDGDGISGVPNWISLASFVTPHPQALTQNGKYIHRFGKKGAAYNLLNQTVNAYNQDMGITSLFSPYDPYSGLKTDPEVSTQTINDVVFYLQTLKAPVQRNTNNPQVLAGTAIFTQINCSGCHKPVLKTGNSPVQSLANKEFFPYTDLLLHDMGSGLDDGYTEGMATSSEWRTPALWGLGLSPNSQGGQYFLMHDGRAHSIEDAILMHGGEAGDSKSKFQQLSPAEKEALLTFLKSL
ncbi:MAG: di-heme oxidoredictase family protein [Bacteroidia bacterium]